MSAGDLVVYINWNQAQQSFKQASQGEWDCLHASVLESDSVLAGLRIVEELSEAVATLNVVGNQKWQDRIEAIGKV